MPDDASGRDSAATPKQPAPSPAEQRAARLAQALRDNLKRRKDQTRGRDATRPQSRDGSGGIDE
jgi:hypothetical protein